MNEIIRNKGRITRMLLLLEMTTNSPGEQKVLADGVGITPQAVSDYISRMTEEGLVKTEDEGPRATVKGVERLNHDLLHIKEFVDSSIGRLDIIRSTDAVAKERIRKGDRVFLSMSQGMLWASATGEGSSGVADEDAMRGEMVSVSSLDGLTDMRKGSLHLVEILPARSGGGRGTIDIDEVRTSLGLEHGEVRTVTLDMEAQSLFFRSSIKPDLEMPPPEGVLVPCDRGLDILALGTPYSVSSLIKFARTVDKDYAIFRTDLEKAKREN